MEYKNTYKVKFFESNSKKELTESFLLKYLSEMAMEHTNELTIKFPDMIDPNMGWMIYKYKGEINKMPKVGEEFKIRTWTSRIYKFYANREFLLLDTNNNVLGQISTLWMYIDLKRRRPKRIPEKYIDYYGIIEKSYYNEFEDLVETIDIENTNCFNVRRSDIDTNKHVNNAIYFEWMIESIPDEIYENYCLKEFNITFKKETMYNDIILSNTELIKVNDRKVICNHLILDKATEEIKTLGKTIWEKRE